MYKLDLLLKEQQTVSSQCLTLGSRYKNICKLCNRQQILGAYAEIMPMMKIRWIPVLDYLDPASHVTSSKMLCFNIRIATFLLTNLMSNQIFWIPVSSTGMTGISTGMTGIGAGMTGIGIGMRGLL